MIGFCLLLINIYLVLKDPMKGIFFYIFCSMVSPVICVFNLYLSYDLIAFLFIFFGYLISRKKNKSHFFFYPILFSFAIMLLSTFYNFAIGEGSINFIGIYGVFRSIVLIFCLADLALDYKLFEKYYYKTIHYLLYLNAIAVFFQVFIPKSVDFFYYLYYKPSLVPLIEAYELGYYPRPSGLFYTPTILGFFLLISFITMFYLWKKTKMKSYRWGILISLICGILSFSKYFYVGVPIIIIIKGLFNFIKYKRIRFSTKNFVQILFFVSISLILFYVMRNVLNISPLKISYYLGFIKDPMSSLDTRLNIDNGGGLFDMITQIYKKPILGNGILNTDMFIGDNSFLAILFYGGLIGFFGYAWVWARIFIVTLKEALCNSIYFLSILGILFANLGTSLTFNVFGGMVLVFSSLPIVRNRLALKVKTDKDVI